MSAVNTPYDEYGQDRQIAQLRIPPHSIAGESSVLGGLLLDNHAWDRVGDVLVDSDFYRYEHKLIYSAIGALVNASKPADVITVFEHLQSQGKAEEIGGLAYLNSLAQYVPSASNIRRYAEIVRDRSILRKLVSASDEIATNAFNPKGRAVSQIVDESEQKIFNIGEQGKRNKQGFQSMDVLAVQLIDRVTELAENELLTAILVTPFAAGTGSSYKKLKRKTGDWATAGAAVVLRMAGGVVTHASIGLTNVAPTALRASAAEALLVGQALTPATLDAVVAAVRTICDPAEDLRGDAEYKTAMAGEMTRRAILIAASRCH